MVTRNRIVAVVLIAIVAVVVYFAFFRKVDDRELLRRKLETIETLVSKAPEETNVTKALKSQKFESIFASPTRVIVHEQMASGSYEPRHMFQLTMRLHNEFEQAELDIYDLEIELKSPEEAEARFSATLTVRQGGASERHTREVLAKARKEEDEWLFYHFEDVEVLRR